MMTDTTIDIRNALALLADQADLSTDEMRGVMRQIMSGDASDAQIGAFLMGMRLKGETVDEITGAVMVMRELSRGVQIEGEHTVDIVGTGGDGANLFNVSTAACFVVAAAGGRVAKHGNRSVSSSCGSADVLEAAGVKLGLEPEQVAQCVDEIGVGFMFAPAHHSAMRHAIGPRKELGVRTLFNILGPMTNPAGVKRLLIGVYDRALCRTVAEVLNRLGAEHVMVVHSADGLDEISLAAVTHVAEAKGGTVWEFELQPADLGIEAAGLDGLDVSSAQESLALIRAAMGGEGSDRARRARNLVALNAGAALHVAGLATDIMSGVSTAVGLLESGAALERLERLAEYSSGL